jgi:hypothetical protein
MRNVWLLAVTLFFAACSRVDKKLDKQSYTESKKSLSDKEMASPLDFLSITSQEKRSFFGLGRATITKGDVTNNATVCSYKNVRIKMLCYDKSGNRVEEHEDVMDDVIEPGESASFRTKYRLPKETDSISVSIMSATGVMPEEKK